MHFFEAIGDVERCNHRVILRARERDVFFAQHIAFRNSIHCARQCQHRFLDITKSLIEPLVACAHLLGECAHTLFHTTHTLFKAVDTPIHVRGKLRECIEYFLFIGFFHTVTNGSG